MTTVYQPPAENTPDQKAVARASAYIAEAAAQLARHQLCAYGRQRHLQTACEALDTAQIALRAFRDQPGLAQ